MENRLCLLLKFGVIKMILITDVLVVLNVLCAGFSKSPIVS